MVSCSNRSLHFQQERMVHHCRLLVRLFWAKPVARYPSKYCYQVPQEPVCSSWRTGFTLQFASREFKDFAAAWQFDHHTSSLYYPQSNRKIENAVKSAKRLLTKAKASGQDPYLTILDWRNTPSTCIGVWPAQRLFGRHTKTLLPTAGTLLQPKIVEGTQEKLKERKANQERYYNKGWR